MISAANYYSPLQPILPNKSADRQFWGGLYGTSKSLAIYHAALQHDAPVVILTPDMMMANQLSHELDFFADQQASLPILTFPDWEILPYDHFSPHQDIISERLATLYQLTKLKKGIVIVPVNTVMHRITPRIYIETHTLLLKKQDQLDLQNFRRNLESYGYRCVNQVMEHGEFAVRGSLIDLYPMGSDLPYRIDLFDEEIDSIRIFDPESQRTLENIEEIKLLPAREFPVTEQGIKQFRQSWRSKFQGNPTLSPIYENMSDGILSPGIEYYLPLFFEQTQTLFDYFPQKSILIRQNDIETKANEFWHEVTQRYEQMRYDITRPLLAPNDIILQIPELFSRIKEFAQIQIQEENLPEKVGNSNFGTEQPPDLKINSKAPSPLEAVANYLAEPQQRILFCAETTGRREAILDLLQTIHISPQLFSNWTEFLNSDAKIAITTGALQEGLVLKNPAITLITESQLFGQQVMQRRLRKHSVQDPANIIRDLTELKIGAPVVHINHGVGRYIGLHCIKTGDYEAEYLSLEYAGGDKLYVPVSSLHQISRYTGKEDENAPLYQLGSKKWEKIKQKAAEKIRDIAAELLDIYARRQAKKGHAFAKPDMHYLTFASQFPFELTADQEKAIEDVITDMTSSHCMDRLICGDVGFGKTEVAMRAAFLAAQDNKQVAILVPTTLLANQHHQNFSDRFADWPVRIESVSRFRSKKDQEKILKETKEGKVDILIGTHKLIQENIQFKALGLLIIDEEHRFGVQQKEKIKSLKAEIDILTLTATPIPRTLNMSLTGIRDLSIIATPPSKRLAIKTFVREYNQVLIREAILREILRGGQVYFLHNDVQSIQHMAETIYKLVPEAKITIAHGQMSERMLEKVMSDFYHARFNVLVSTTIIESGIDIPTANTMIINKANQFGLAQLHQLRGRVGRSHHQAYAYLFTPQLQLITKDAQKRLEAIETLGELGSGFTLATYDLEIRGSGEILGEEQSGYMEEIGFTLYMDMLEDTVQALKEGKEPLLEQPMKQGTEVDLQITALFPESYIPDVHTRLTLYKRIANAKNLNALQELQVEIIDRFGLLPLQVKNLFRITELKLQATPLGIYKIDARLLSGTIEFGPTPNINVTELLKLIQNHPKQYQMMGKKGIRYQLANNEIETKFNTIHSILEKLKP